MKVTLIRTDKKNIQHYATSELARTTEGEMEFRLWNGLILPTIGGLDNNQKIEQRCSKGAAVHYLTTENPEKFKEQAQIFPHEPVEVENFTLVF